MSDSNTPDEKLPYPSEGPVNTGSFRVLEIFDERAAETNTALPQDVRKKVNRALIDFPELHSETITIARLDPDDAEDGTHGRAGVVNRIVYLPTDRATSYITMYHELAHLLIRLQDEDGDAVPTTSEEYCSLVGMARMPVKLIDETRIPYLGQPVIDAKHWPAVCEAALEYREDHHAYIQQAKDWLHGKKTPPIQTGAE